MKPKDLARIKSIYNFAWTPDGRSILFVTNLALGFDIWDIPAEGGYPRQVTFLNRNVSNLAVPLKGDWMAFTCDPEAKEVHELYLLPLKGREPQKTDILIKFLPIIEFSPDGRFLLYIDRDEKGSNLYLYDVMAKKTRKLTDDEEQKYEATFSKDGRFIAYTVFREALRNDVILLDVESGHRINLTEDIGGENKELSFSRDNRYLAFVSDAKGINNVLIFDLQRMKPLRWLPEIPYERRSPSWSVSGKLAYVVVKEGNLLIEIMSSPFGDLEPVEISSGSVFDFKWSPLEDRMVLKYSDDVTPVELYLLQNGEILKLTDSLIRGISQKDFSLGEHIRYRSFDGLEIPAFYYKPRGKGPFPALVWIHGGPTSLHFNGFNPFVQLAVSNGIAVLAPNYRGSAGYGKDFENRNFRDWGGGDLEDIVYAAHYLKSLPEIDSSRIAVGGGSYGGYLSLLALGKYPDVWKAGIDWMGPVNLKTLYYTTAPWLRVFLQKKYGFKSPEEDPEFYTERSPINFVDNIKAPLQLIYGVNDPRVPASELEQVEEKLKKFGKIYEKETLDEGHSLWNPESRLKIFTLMVDFLKRHLLGG